jgi:hypothetical protein
MNYELLYLPEIGGLEEGWFLIEGLNSINRA